MFMPFPMFKRIYSSIAAGGGVLGKVAGTAHITTTEVGFITEACHLLTEIFLPVGDIVTEITNGKDIRGNISGYRIRNFNAIGRPGKETGIGNRKHGVSKDCRPDSIPQEWEISRNSNKVAISHKTADPNTDKHKPGKLRAAI
jgi:hypothetical protein